MDLEQATVVVDGKNWEKNLPELGDLEVLVAPWENKAFERELSKQIRALPAGLRAEGTIDPGAYYGCVGRAMVKTILYDWKNLKVGGQEKTYDKAYATELLTDPKYRPVRDGVIAAARRVQQGIKIDDEATLGNSEASLPGVAGGEATRTG